MDSRNFWYFSNARGILGLLPMKSAFAPIGSKKILWQKSKLLVVSNFRQTVRKVFDSSDSR